MILFEPMYLNINEVQRMEKEMALQKIDFGAELRKGWQLFQANMGVLITMGAIVAVVMALTGFILLAPLAAGMLLIARRLLKNDPVKPQAGDVFKGFEFFVQTLLVCILAFLMGVVVLLIANYLDQHVMSSIMVGLMLIICCLAILAVVSMAMWAFLFVVYQRLPAIDAIKKVLEYTKNGEFTMPILFALVVTLISCLGVIVCGVGSFVTLPIGYCMMACCYETLFGDEPPSPPPQ